MNKKELTTVAILILLMPVWLWIDRTYISPMFPEEPPAATPTPSTPDAAPTADPVDGAAVTPAVETPDPSGIQTVSELPEVVTEPEAPSEPFPLVHTDDEGNPVITATFNARGGALDAVTLHRYPESLENRDTPDQDPIVLNFAGGPGLLLEAPGLGATSGYTVTRDGEALVLSNMLGKTLRLDRRVSFVEGQAYVLEVTDSWTNLSEGPIAVPQMELSLGQMIAREDVNQKYGPYLGVDVALPGQTKVERYWKNMRKGLKNQDTYTETFSHGVQWFSIKNKFFTQVLTLSADNPASGLTLQAKKGEGKALIESAQASTSLSPLTLAEGETRERKLTYYVGPVSMSRLSALGEGQQKVVDFRLWTPFVPIATTMMKGLHGLHGLTGNWGLAIILLTFVVRMLFWPLTQKGAENMKRMSEFQPQMKEIREKYKSNPTKLNAEMGAFYKKHKINPLAGCLPMFVQIPVFISLYGVLRVAVELRFADFLWIRDLSEQEALFYIGGFAVNILPLTMGSTMILQQRLAPSNMDPQQQKIMTMMPIFFLFITYSMPSGLLLYWTTSNLVSIYQTTHTKRRDAKREAVKKAGGDGSGPGKPKK